MKLSLPSLTSMSRTGRTPPRPYVGEELVCLLTDAGSPRGSLRRTASCARYLEERGTWEPDEGQPVEPSSSSPGLRFLDVGANVGYFSLLVAQPTARAPSSTPSSRTR